MAMSLDAVLAHPGLAQSDPVLLAGDPTGRPVRWVHSSEVYDIAPLLRGGELLLTTGLGLLGVSADQRRAYVRGLAERGVAGLALELSGTFREVPDDMVDEARAVGLPFVALRTVYPFVEVTMQVNSAILDRSIARLRHADEIGRALSRVLADRGGVGTLVATLSELVSAPVVLADERGTVVAASGEQASSVAAAPALEALVTAEGIVLGRLLLGDPAADPERVQAALERAPEIFALELLRGRNQSLLSGRERRELLARLLTGTTEDAAALTAHAALARIRGDCRWAGLVVTSPAEGAALSLVHDLSLAAGLPVLAAEVESTAYALIAVVADGSTSELRRAAARWLPPVRAALGPVVAAGSAGRSLRAARDTVSAVGYPGPQRLVRAQDAVVERLLAAVTDVDRIADLVDEQLGGLLRSSGSATLLETLEAFLVAGGNKAATARVLHLRRQSVHQRLARISALLGYDVADPSRHTPLRLALTARHVVP